MDGCGARPLRWRSVLVGRLEVDSVDAHVRGEAEGSGGGSGKEEQDAGWREGPAQRSRGARTESAPRPATTPAQGETRSSAETPWMRRHSWRHSWVNPWGDPPLKPSNIHAGQSVVSNHGSDSLAGRRTISHSLESSAAFWSQRLPLTHKFFERPNKKYNISECQPCLSQRWEHRTQKSRCRGFLFCHLLAKVCNSQDECKMSVPRAVANVFQKWKLSLFNNGKSEMKHRAGNCWPMAGVFLLVWGLGSFDETNTNQKAWCAKQCMFPRNVTSEESFSLLRRLVSVMSGLFSDQGVGAVLFQWCLDLFSDHGIGAVSTRLWDAGLQRSEGLSDSQVGIIHSELFSFSGNAWILRPRRVSERSGLYSSLSLLSSS